MCHPATEWAWGLSLPPTQRLVLLAMARAVKEASSWVCHQEQSAIALSCSISTRQLREHIRALATQGLLAVDTQGRAGGGRGANAYVLNPGGGPQVQGKAEADRRFAQSKAEADRHFAQSKAEADRHFAPGKAEADRLFAPSNAEADRHYAQGQSGSRPPLCPPTHSYSSSDHTQLPIRGELEESPLGEKSVFPLPPRAHAQPAPAPAPFDYRAIAAALRPDLDPDPVWDKFCIYHSGSEFSVHRQIKLWRGWLARELKSKKISPITDSNKSPKRVLGGFATHQAPADIIVTDYEVHQHGT